MDNVSNKWKTLVDPEIDIAENTSINILLYDQMVIHQIEDTYA